MSDSTRFPALKFLITNSCNLRCQYCHNEFQGNVNQNNNCHTFDSKTVDTILRNYCVHYPTNGRIKISGGEPLLFDAEVFKILRIASLYPVEKIILTNLTKANLDTLLGFRNLGVTQIRCNVPSFSRTIYCHRTRASDFEYDSLMNFVNVTRSLYINVIANMVLPESNLEDFLLRELELFKQSRFCELRFLIDIRGLRLKNNIDAIEILNHILDHNFVQLGRSKVWTCVYGRISITSCTLWEMSPSNIENDYYIIPPGKNMTTYKIGYAYMKHEDKR
jgi:molybdenum cofactor biosynthesis enzyme MoaA